MRLAFCLIFLLGCSHKIRIVSSSPTHPRAAHEAKSSRAMVASQGQATTRAALWAMDQGGNIIDAFVAASFAISVERPHSTGIGGGGFLLFFSKEQNKVFAFDFREIAPLKSKENMYLTKSGKERPKLSQEGALAVATPGLVKGLYEIHRNHGSLPWKDLLTPAIRLARGGFPLYEELQEAMEDRKNLLLKDPEAKKIFFPEGKTPFLGAMIYQEDLAQTLEQIARLGSDGFYTGKVARALVTTVKSRGGILSFKDLKNYKVKQREPVSATYKGLKVFSMPPPSSGGVHVIQILKMLEKFDLHSLKPQTAESVHLIASAMQKAFRDRAEYLGDPDFSQVPTADLVSDKYLEKMSGEISLNKTLKATDVKLVPFPKESDETTHFTIADASGNMVASTQTINGWFGSGVIAKGTGIILNNEMDDFAQKVGVQNLFGAVGGSRNLVQPKKRPLSSMSPTIITKNGEPLMALGSPSGTRIITCVAQTILNTFEFKMPLYESVAATRIHHQWLPDQIKIEAPFLHPEEEKKLKQMGHDVVHGRIGCSIQAIKKIKSGWHGVSDPRGEGLALGL